MPRKRKEPKSTLQLKQCDNARKAFEASCKNNRQNLPMKCRSLAFAWIVAVAAALSWPSLSSPCTYPQVLVRCSTAGDVRWYFPARYLRDQREKIHKQIHDTLRSELDQKLLETKSKFEQEAKVRLFRPFLSFRVHCCASVTSLEGRMLLINSASHAMSLLL